MVDTSAQSVEKWWLVAHLPPSSRDSRADIDVLRDVSVDELVRTRDANSLLKRLVAAAPYGHLVELFLELDDVYRSEVSPQRAALNMNRAVRTLGSEAQRLGLELRRQAAEDFDTDLEVEEVDQAIEEECGRSEFRVLLELPDLEAGPFIAVEDDLEVDSEAVSQLEPLMNAPVNSESLVQAIRMGLVVAQRLIGRQLKVYEQQIAEASRHLRDLAAEVPDGSPALMRSDRLDPASGNLDLGQVTFEPLALDSAVYLHRALRHAGQLLAATKPLSAEEVEGIEGTAGRIASEPSEEFETETRSGPGSEAGTDDSSLSSGPDVRQDLEEPRGQVSGEPEDLVVDFRALTRHVGELTDELERVWSDALDPDSLKEAKLDVQARLSSLLNTILRRMAASDQMLRVRDIDPKIANFPLSQENIANLTLTPDPEQRWRQLQHAQIEAMQALLQALEGLNSPSAHQIDLVTGETESWWEAGAFESIRSRLHLLARVFETAAQAEARVAGKDFPVDSRTGFQDHLQLADYSLRHGDPEGSLVHCSIALRMRAFDIGKAPPDLLERLAADDRLSEGAPLLRLLAQATETLGSGAEVDIGVATLVAPRVLQMVANLCIETPDIISDAASTPQVDDD